MFSESQRYDHLYGKHGSIYPGVVKAEGGGCRKKKNFKSVHVCSNCGIFYETKKNLTHHLKYTCANL